MLLLKRHLVELVRAGKKRQTIRLWSRALLRAGQVSYTPGLGKMLITSVEILADLEALTETDAVADGFASLKELRAEIRRIYGPGIPAGRSVFRITFNWPVDDAGKKLQVTLPAAKAPTPESPGRKKSASRKSATAPAKKTASGNMNPGEREALRAFLVSHAPGK